MNDPSLKDQLARLVNGYWHTQTIYVAAKLGIADLLKDGPRSAEELATVTGTNPRALCRQTTKDGEPAVEWSWDGNAEMDAAQGRGWAVLRGDELHGMIFFHGGDESEFVARKKGGKKAKG